MSFTGANRSLTLRISRSFSTSSSSSNSQSQAAEPRPPRRKGRIPRVDPKTQSLLPPQKLRALISLYHQSNDFITPKNLEERIDAAFKYPHPINNTISQHGLDQNLRTQRTASIVSTWNQDIAGVVSGKSWSSTMSKREREVIDALCGVETSRSTGKTLPGYGTLMEWKKRKESQ